MSTRTCSCCYVLDDIEKILDDNLFPDSKDWMFDRSSVARVEYLIACIKSQREELDNCYKMLERKG